MTSFFFFQAEDGIRDVAVTGVQTCALPIWDWLFVDDFIDHRGDALARERLFAGHHFVEHDAQRKDVAPAIDRKSTRLNSSHGYISYAVFCLKKKKQKRPQ